MQRFILVTLILGLAFFLYLIKTGDINSDDFNIRKLQSPVEFTIKKQQVSGTEVSSTIYLNINDLQYKVYTFTGSSFDHVPRSEYYKKIYDIPLEAKDAVSGIWLGSRYVFYVVQEGENLDAVYKVYKTEYSTDSLDGAEYSQILTVKGTEASNKIDVRY